MTLAWAGGIFIRYCKEDTCFTLVDLRCTFDLYIVYHGSSKKVLTAFVKLADCVGSLNSIVFGLLGVLDFGSVITLNLILYLETRCQ